jgi:hypothetical protein
MFADNKYTHIYTKIINRAKDRTLSTYKEKHHIIPTSLGGSNNNNNLVELTAREHFICHLLLTKMTTGNNRNKMISAVFFLTGRGKATGRANIIKSSRLYSKLKEEHAKYVSSVKKGCKQPPRTLKTRQKLSASKTGSLNPKFKNNWVTPWGVYASSRLAAAACPDKITAATVLNFCQRKSATPISYLSVCRAKGWLKEEHIGKTPNQLGFNIL